MQPTLNTTLSAPSLYILLALTDRPLHGYGIRQQVALDSCSRLIMAPGTPYILLKRLIRDRLVERLDESTIYEKQIRYRLTGQGRRRLADELKRLKLLVVDLERRNLA